MLAKKGITEEQIVEQLACFQTGFPFLKLDAAASIEKGILAPDAEEQKAYLAAWDAYTNTDKTVVKFVPASGAASRMFKNLFEFLSADYDRPTTKFEQTFFDGIKNFAFYDDLNVACQRIDGKDIPGLIEGASEGVGLGHEFLRHIERTRVLVHIVDAASTEGRDPVDDIYKINKELEAYNPEIAARPQLIAANKIDCIFEDGEENPVDRLRAEFEPKGIKVYPVSAATGQGIRELLFGIRQLLDESPAERIVFEQEFFPEDVLITENLPYTVTKAEDDPHVFVVEGPKIEKMLGYTNLDSEKGFAFFQRFLKDGGILDELENAGIEEGDTVRMYGFDFDYYK